MEKRTNPTPDKRTNLTPHVDFITLVVMFLGFKFLDDRIMYALIVMFLIHYTLIRIAEHRGLR